VSIADVLNALNQAGRTHRPSGAGYDAQCPAHPDNTPSLHIEDGDNGGVILTCYAGCVLDDILGELGLTRDAVRPPRRDPEEDNIDTYRYTDEKGELLYEVVRRPGKKFLQRRPDLSAESGWTWKLGDVRRPLYRLPKVLQAIADGETIYVVEGEKDVHALERAGHVATCNSGGAGKWLPEHTASLGAANVIIVADRDTPGRSHSRFVEHALEDVADSVRRVEAAQGKDAYDHLAAGLSVDEFLTVSEDEEAIDLAPELADFLKIHDAYDWLVPGLLEQGERLILTGFEGQGKSELLRQIAVCVAAGVDPLQFHRIEPRRVLFIDCENSDRQTRRRLRPLADLLARSYEPVGPKMMYILTRPKGLDLTREDDATWLHERMVAHKPELLIIGPLYKLHAQNPNDELAARQVVMALDDAMATAGCALILEAHAGHGDGKGQRNVRPTGSSLWLRWPDFGYGLVPTGVGDDQMEFRRWRGPRGDRKWPEELHRGNSWPWEGKWPKGMPNLGEPIPVAELFDEEPF
jgi:5S rRNA maturation endonuclease (ribonuclease M5)